MASEVRAQAERLLARGEAARAAHLLADAGLPFEAAAAYLVAGDTGRALKSYVRVRPDDPRYREACVLAIGLVAESEVTLEFENFIAAFVRIGPRAAEEREAFYRLGRLYRDQGFPENAVEALHKVVTVDPDYRDASALLVSLRRDAPGELPDLPEPPSLSDTLAQTWRQADPAAATNRTQSPVFDVGATIADRYRIEERIGRGGSSVVFRATDLVLAEDAALKVFTQAVYDEEDDLRFKRELSLSRQLVHSNIVRIYDIGLFHGFRYITMELLRGGDLRTRMGRGPLPLREGLDYLLQACAGLEVAHARGVVHRDIKPENCFVTRDGTLKLMDFGIAKVQEAPGLTVTGIIAGTPSYMAPEQAMSFRSATASSDIYALGVVAYEIFTGTVPFENPEMMPLLLMHANAPPPRPRTRNPAIPEDLEQVVLTCLEKEPDRRFRSCRELGERLEQIRRRSPA